MQNFNIKMLYLNAKSLKIKIVTDYSMYLKLY